MKNITPFLWFDNQAEKALNFYISVFKDARIKNLKFYGKEGPGKEGTVKSCTFILEGLEIMAIDGGPEFHFTPAISFFINCDTEFEADELWNKLSNEGTALYDMDKRPFGTRYGWLQDKFGIFWQINLISSAQKIVPFLTFAGKQSGRAQEAVEFYVSVFDHSDIIAIYLYQADEGGVEGKVKHCRFLLYDQEFLAMDGGAEKDLEFNPATSLFVQCETQEEIDSFWEKLSAQGGEQGVCGWLTDRFGVSWQVVPAALDGWLNDSDSERAKRVMDALLKMRKIEIEGLRQAFEGRGEEQDS